jgi:site-specific DNA-methyltransferase (adenine-specific)
MPRCLNCKAPLIIKLRGSHRKHCSDRCRQATCRKKRKAKRLALLAERRTQWYTPPERFAEWNAQYGPFDLDPCATADNAKCAHYFTREQDGLKQRWFGRVFLNPPFGRLDLWLQKAWESVASGDAELVVCLLPARTETGYWHDVCALGEVTFVRGRLKFGGVNGTAPFASAVVVFRCAICATK